MRKRPGHHKPNQDRRGTNAQETAFQSPFGHFELNRYPKENDPTLRAWTAADELMLSYVKEELPSPSEQPLNILIANDNFGALTVCLHQYQPSLWSDSFICQQAATKNAQLNQLPHELTFLPSTAALPHTIDVALISLPKNHHYLRFQLEKIKAKLSPNGIIVASVMVKHFHHNALQHFENIIGNTHTSLAQKKARLIIATNDGAAIEEKHLDQYASEYPLETQASQQQPVLKTLPNVFSREKLDIGTRVLLPHLPSSPDFHHIIDLGCGNGALGIQAALLNPQAQITFCDESYLAIESARLSVNSAQENTGLRNACQFIVTDTLQQAPGHADLILCNPPFHQQSSMHTEIAYRMFKESHQHLSNNGQLWVVANQHLKYLPALKKRFRDVIKVQQTNKFIILQAIK